MTEELERVPDGISFAADGRLIVGINGVGIVYTLRPTEMRTLAAMLTEAASRIESDPALALSLSPVVGVA